VKALKLTSDIVAVRYEEKRNAVGWKRRARDREGFIVRIYWDKESSRRYGHIWESHLIRHAPRSRRASLIAEVIIAVQLLKCSRQVTHERMGIEVYDFLKINHKPQAEYLSSPED
jgi:hypothetical protein